MRSVMWRAHCHPEVLVKTDWAWDCGRQAKWLQHRCKLIHLAPDGQDKWHWQTPEIQKA